MQIYPFGCQEWACASVRAAARMRTKQTDRNNSNMHFMIAVTKGTIVMGK